MEPHAQPATANEITLAQSQKPQLLLPLLSASASMSDNSDLIKVRPYGHRSRTASLSAQVIRTFKSRCRARSLTGVYKACQNKVDGVIAARCQPLVRRSGLAQEPSSWREVGAARFRCMLYPGFLSPRGGFYMLQRRTGGLSMQRHMAFLCTVAPVSTESRIEDPF